MSTLETAQTGIDNVGQQGGSDQYSARPIVDMANPSEFRNLVRPLDSQSQSAVSSNGQLVFDNPYGSSATNGGQGRWNEGNAGNNDGGQWGGDRGGHRGRRGGGQSGIDGGGNIAGEDGVLSKETGTLQTEVNAFGPLGQNGAVATDSATTAAASPTDNATTTTAVAAPGANTTASADQLVTQLAQSGDPTLAGTLMDASTQLSAQGYGQLEQYVGQNYSGSANDNQLMNQALTQAGLSPSDASALQNVLTTDMPQALSSSDSTGAGCDSGSSSSQSSNASFDQQVLAQLQQIGQEVQQLTAEVTQLLGGSGTTGTTGSDTGSGTTTTTGSDSGSSSASTTSTDPIQQQIAQTDPELGQMLTDMQSNGMSQSGYQQFEQNVAQDLQSGQYPDDQSLMNAAVQQFAQQGGSAQDQSVASTTIANDIAQYGDASVSTYNSAGSSGTATAGGSDTGAGTTTSGGSDIGAGTTTSGGSDTGAGTTTSGGSDTGAGTTTSGGSDSGAGTTTSAGSGAGSTSGTGGDSGAAGSSGTGGGADMSSAIQAGPGITAQEVQQAVAIEDLLPAPIQQAMLANDATITLQTGIQSGDFYNSGNNAQVWIGSGSENQDLIERSSELAGRLSTNVKGLWDDPTAVQMTDAALNAVGTNGQLTIGNISDNVGTLGSIQGDGGLISNDIAALVQADNPTATAGDAIGASYEQQSVAISPALTSYIANSLGINDPFGPSGTADTVPPDENGAGTAASPVTATGQFTTQNGQIIGPDGQPFQIKGINIDAAGLQLALNNVDNLADNWKINQVRINDYSHTMPIMDGNGNPDFTELNTIVNAFTSKGIVVELDPESPNSSEDILTGQALASQTNFDTQVAAYYKNNPYVWIGTTDEAGSNATDPAGWLNEVQSEVSAVRATGNTNPVVVDDTYWSNASIHDPSQSGLIQDASTLLPYGNLIAAIHTYGDSEASIEAGANALAQAGYVPFVQEYSASQNAATAQGVINLGEGDGLSSDAYTFGTPAQDGANSINDANGNPTGTYGNEVYNYYNQAS